MALQSVTLCSAMSYPTLVCIGAHRSFARIMIRYQYSGGRPVHYRFTECGSVRIESKGMQIARSIVAEIVKNCGRKIVIERQVKRGQLQ